MRRPASSLIVGPSGNCSLWLARRRRVRPLICFSLVHAGWVVTQLWIFRSSAATLRRHRGGDRRYVKRRRGASQPTRGVLAGLDQQPRTPVDRRHHHAGNPNYSALMPAALMIGHHFSISALWNAASACGVCSSRDTICWPRSASRWRTPGSVSASTAAALSLATTSGGVPFGAISAFQTVQ